MHDVLSRQPHHEDVPLDPRKDMQRLLLPANRQLYTIHIHMVPILVKEAQDTVQITQNLKRLPEATEFY